VRKARKEKSKGPGRTKEKTVKSPPFKKGIKNKAMS